MRSLKHHEAIGLLLQLLQDDPELNATESL